MVVARGRGRRGLVVKASDFHAGGRGSIPAQVRSHSNTIRQGMNP